MLYVLIGFCFKRVFSAESQADALKQAAEIASENKLHSWLLYNRLGDEIGHSY